MKKVFIKYNPYKLETEITVDGNQLAQNSQLGEKAAKGTHLQEWVEDLPRILIDEYNDTEFEVTFHGTLLDYEDLKSAFTEAQKRHELTFKLEHKPAKETADKEALIDNVFKEIQEGPFDELRDKQIISAFEHAKSKDFEVCVVATMSAGKSTLINAMLGTKLMPSKQEACTAIITRIKDTNDKDVPWKAKVYNKEGQLTETHEALNYSTMERLNADENVSEIRAEGNIPFVSSEDVSLVLIDTPGPNNSRDPHHKKVQSEFLSKSSKALVLYIMTGEFGTDDDYTLLKRVAESMSVGGKQSKDRFIFVINKLDGRKKEDGDTEQTLERVRAYLKTHGIDNPNLFPAAALPALDFRLITSGADVDEDTRDEAYVKARKLNRNETMHFETYAPLPTGIRNDIALQLTKAKASKSENAIYDEALIHTGIPSLEAAIRQYVQKYAKTAKIKNIVDTFIHKLDEVDCYEKTKRELAKNCDENEKLSKQIALIRKKIDDGESAKKFKVAVDTALRKVKQESPEIVEGILEKFQNQITQKIDSFRDIEIDIADIDIEINRLKRFAESLEPYFESELDDLIRTTLIKTSEALLEEYKKKLEGLAEDINIDGFNGAKIDPLKLMGGSVNAENFQLAEFIREKRVEDGKEWVKNTDKKWYKPWTWFQEKGYYRQKYKTVEFVDASEMVRNFFMPIEKSLFNNGSAALLYALQQANKIAKYFDGEFKRLDKILDNKLKELESYANDKAKAEQRIKECERKLAWLDEIKGKVNSILEI
ncbi:MAG: Dynamin-N domain-containing protein [Clostridium sp.]|jgi:GTPase SAR1 family protein/methionine salvage enolase-phosphatase E1